MVPHGMPQEQPLCADLAARFPGMCHIAVVYIAHAIDFPLDMDEEAWVRSHVEECPSCHLSLQHLEATRLIQAWKSYLAGSR